MFKHCNMILLYGVMHHNVSIVPKHLPHEKKSMIDLKCTWKSAKECLCQNFNDIRKMTSVTWLSVRDKDEKKKLVRKFQTNDYAPHL